ncbi:hypothetical protein BH20ACT9_BH20ACT9_00700 [soil metagenome]
MTDSSPPRPPPVSLCGARRGRRPRVALYSHDTQGLGHVRRNLAVSGALAASDPAPELLLISGAREARARLAGPPGPPVMVHRDFYDKQAFVGNDGRVELLDFDTLARGEAALDVANALAHVELRVLQARLARPAADRVAAAFLEGYRPARR